MWLIGYGRKGPKQGFQPEKQIQDSASDQRGHAGCGAWW